MFYQSRKHSVENTRLRLMFSTFPSCSQMSVMFYHSMRLKLLYLLNKRRVNFKEWVEVAHNAEGSVLRGIGKYARNMKSCYKPRVQHEQNRLRLSEL